MSERCGAAATRALASTFSSLCAADTFITLEPYIDDVMDLVIVLFITLGHQADLECIGLWRCPRP